MLLCDWRAAIRENRGSADAPLRTLPRPHDDDESIFRNPRGKRLTKGTLTYVWRPIAAAWRGNAARDRPAHAGPVTLFIDPFGRPLSPISVYGMRRRERRRMRRRL